MTLCHGVAITCDRSAPAYFQLVSLINDMTLLYVCIICNLRYSSMATLTQIDRELSYYSGCLMHHLT